MGTNKYLLARIIGNDLPPRHAEGQTLSSLQFILDNEKEFKDTLKHFVLNRIVDEKTLAEYKKILSDRSMSYSIIPFDLEVYSSHRTFPGKAGYITNVNHARNFILDIGRYYNMTFPGDGNCFFTEAGWQSLVDDFDPIKDCAIVLMARCTEYPNEETKPRFYENYKISDKIMTCLTEPQIAFNRGTEIRYNVNYSYGSASKVELLLRLGVPGIWELWFKNTEELGNLEPNTPHAGRYPCAGWCYRLPSGVSEAETDNKVRSNLRMAGLNNIVRMADSMIKKSSVK